MKSLCIYIHYKNREKIPVYVQMYVNELAKYFDEVVIVHNEPYYTINDVKLSEKISFAAFPNEGYDFGLFYNYFSKLDHSQYHQVACINDSNVLFNEFEPIFNWANKQNIDFWGLLDSSEKPWFSTHKNNYHIQSHFLVFNKMAIDSLNNYFSTTEIDLIFNEKDRIKLRRLVIDKWEIGLSRYLFDRGLVGKSYINSERFLEQINIRKPMNLGHKFYVELIEAGLPIIKKKVIMSHSWKNSIRSKTNWETIVEKYGNKLWDIEALITEMKQFKREDGIRFMKISQKNGVTFNKFHLLLGK